MKKNNNGGLGYIGDEVLPSYMEIIIIVNNYKDPYYTHTIGPKAFTSWDLGKSAKSYGIYHTYTPLFEACVASRLLGQQALVPRLNMSPENLYLPWDLLYMSQKLHTIARMIVWHSVSRYLKIRYLFPKTPSLLSFCRFRRFPPPPTLSSREVFGESLPFSFTRIQATTRPESRRTAGPESRRGWLV